MKSRDRLILMGVIVVVVLGGAWMLVVSPERQKAVTVNEQVASAKTSLATAEGELSKARSAQSQYTAAYSAIVSLGKAVPATDEQPSLIYEIANAAENKAVNFEGIHSSSSSSSSSGDAASAIAASFSAMPYSLNFNGSFFELEHLFRKLTSFDTVTSKGQVSVNGRLLTIQGMTLTGGTKGSAASSTSGTSSAEEPELSGSVSVTAYVLPGGQTVTAGATPTSPAGATPASSTGSSPATPATATVNP